jgi:hypothetical protein
MKYLLVLLSFLCLLSCSVKYLPVAGGGVTVQDDFGIIKTEEMIFIANHRYWNLEPKNISDYFIAFHITIQNRTAQTIEINSQELSLIDEEGNQYDALPLEYIETLLLPDELRYEYIPELTETLTQLIENWRDARQNLMRESFHFGRVLPNAKRSGFVFFNKLPSSHKRCDINFQDKTITFEKYDKKKK